MRKTIGIVISLFLIFGILMASIALYYFNPTVNSKINSIFGIKAGQNLRDYNALQTKMDSLEKDVVDIDALMSTYNQDKQSYNSSLENVNNLIDSLKAEQESLKSYLELDNSDVVAINERLSDIDVQISTLKVSKATIENKIENINVKIDNLELEKASLESQIEEIEAEIAQIKSDIASVSNPNILINGGFRVNQRGNESYTSGYSVDRWIISGATLETSLVSTCVQITNVGSEKATFTQKIEESSFLLGKTVTLSLKTNGNNEKIYSVTGTIGDSWLDSDCDVITGSSIDGLTLRLSYEAESHLFSFVVDIDSSKQVKISYCKLELGSVATAYSPKSYSEELIACQRYYTRILVSVISSVYNNTIFSGLTLPVEMRDVPSLSKIDECYLYKYDGTYIGVGYASVDRMVGSSVVIKVTCDKFVGQNIYTTNCFAVVLDAEI